VRRLLQWCVCITAALTLGAGAALAQFPDRPVRLLVPYPPGGLVDILARTLQEPLSVALGQPLIVENKPGAAGGIATRFVAQSKPDGYTLIFGNNGPSALLPLIQKDTGYDPVDDFAPISMIATAPMVLVVHKDVPVDNLKDFIAYARLKAGAVTYSSAGIGALGHLTTELFAQMADLKLIHVPYKGSAPAVMAVLDGEVQMYLSSPSDTLSAGLKAGKVKLLGVSPMSGSELVPGASPIAAALPDFDVSIWYGVLAPRDTPPAVVERLNKAFREVLAQPVLQSKFGSFGAVAGASAPAELSQRIVGEVAKWRGTIQSAGIAIQ
jgi:tripartite-type tricarboxylate transporter receptor subunit TctC